MSKLQVVAEVMPAVRRRPAATALRDDRIETFDFMGLVNAPSDNRAQPQPRPVQVGLSPTPWRSSIWVAATDAAPGGDLAYQYGTNGTLVGIAANVAQDTAGSSQLGKQAQALHSQTGVEGRAGEAVLSESESPSTR